VRPQSSRVAAASGRAASRMGLGNVGRSSECALYAGLP
jgi:hypothetical protein